MKPKGDKDTSNNSRCKLKIGGANESRVNSLFKKG